MTLAARVRGVTWKSTSDPWVQIAWIQVAWVQFAWVQFAVQFAWVQVAVQVAWVHPALRRSRYVMPVVPCFLCVG
jgi:hypothetical protein